MIDPHADPRIPHMSISFQTGGEPIPGYKLMERLGSGGFGEVWRCEAPGGIFKAAKVIYGDLRERDTDSYRFAEQELKSLKRVKAVRHPYLLSLDRYDIVEGRLVIVMELADCNLWERFREHRRAGRPGIPREELLQYMAETAEVLDLMNDKHQLQHLDIKPQNLFLLYNHVKVADFGQVKDLEGLVASVTGGITPVYAAPETFDGFVSRFCDQYSLACVYQELLTGHRPFDGTSMQQLLMQHLQAPPNLLPSPAGERSALAKALSKKPDDRFPNVSSMVKAIREGSAVRVAVPAAVPAGFGSELPAFDCFPPTYNPSDVAQGTSLPYGLDGGGGIALDSTPNPRGVVETTARPRPTRKVPAPSARPSSSGWASPESASSGSSATASRSASARWQTSPPCAVWASTAIPTPSNGPQCRSTAGRRRCPKKTSSPRASTAPHITSNR